MRDKGPAVMELPFSREEEQQHKDINTEMSERGGGWKGPWTTNEEGQVTTQTGAVQAEGQGVQRPDTAMTLAVCPVSKGAPWLCGCDRQQETGGREVEGGWGQIAARTAGELPGRLSAPETF